VEEGEQTRVGKGCQDSSIVTGKSLIVFSLKIVKKFFWAYARISYLGRLCNLIAFQIQAKFNVIIKTFF
jgi:hypothetical protein